MRRILALLLIAAALFGLSACYGGNQQISIQGDHATNQEGVFLEILSAEKNEEKGNVLHVRWHNDTDRDVLYGTAFSIERLEGKTWTKLKARKNTAFTAIGILLKANSTADKSYSLDWVYDVSKPGNYRFTTECGFLEDDGTRIALWAEFTVGSTSETLKTDAQYIRTGGYHGGRKYPKAAFFSTRADLENYYHENKSFYSLDRTGGFYEAIGVYDGAFFEKNNLLTVLLEEGSGSISHMVRKLEYSDGKLSAWIDRIVPEAGTCDMAQWHILIPVEKKFASGQISVYLDDNLAYEMKPVSPSISWADDAFKAPPKLEIISDAGSFDSYPGGYQWNYAAGDGTWVAGIADALHPLQMKEYLPLISCGTNQVQLMFENDPDSVSVRCWPDSQWGHTDAKSDVPDVWDRVVDLKVGNWIYEVTAVWNDDGDNYHGRATYVFYVSPAATNPGINYSVDPHSSNESVTGLCGNSVTTVHLAGESYSFVGKDSIALTVILGNLAYDPQKVCRCMTEYTVDTEFGKGYGINLTQGFARCEKGQAELSKEQIETIRAIMDWVEKETKAR